MYMFRSALISMFITSAALADTWTVDDDGKADFDNIQAAVDAASDGDEIVVMPGTYSTTGLAPGVDMKGKAVWLHSSGGAEVTIIDGEGVRRGILCDSGETSKTIIEGFRIINGDGTFGGGGYCEDANPIFKNCMFENNSANYGGGMYSLYDSIPTLDGCSFTNNSANYGGGMYGGGSIPITLTDCTFENNSADYNGGGIQGANMTLTNCIFMNNTATNGGGIFCEWNLSFILENCMFQDNIATNGGGMYNYLSSPTLENCTFEGNAATTDGGGIYAESANNFLLANCTFEHNVSLERGGGIHISNSNATLTGCTFVENGVQGNWLAGIVGRGGGLFAAASTISLTDCIFDKNAAGIGPDGDAGENGGSGGGVYVGWNSTGKAGTTLLTECMFMNNIAKADGGGAYINCDVTEFSIDNCTFSDNDAWGAPALGGYCGCGQITNTLFCSNGGYWGTQTNCGIACIGSNTCAQYCVGGCPDIDQNGEINVTDLLFIIDFWETTNSDLPFGDVTLDGVVDISDLLLIISNWGPCE